jgi:hypothetical protein
MSPVTEQFLTTLTGRGVSEARAIYRRLAAMLPLD